MFFCREEFPPGPRLRVLTDVAPSMVPTAVYNNSFAEKNEKTKKSSEIINYAVVSDYN